MARFDEAVQQAEALKQQEGSRNPLKSPPDQNKTAGIRDFRRPNPGGPVRTSVMAGESCQSGYLRLRASRPAAPRDRNARLVGSGKCP